MKPGIALICGVPPMCDRCAEQDAHAFIRLPGRFGQRCMCEKCIVELIQTGLAMPQLLDMAASLAAPLTPVSQELEDSPAYGM